jgi:uncharacterized cupredoxin-like copper-binding protein
MLKVFRFIASIAVAAASLTVVAAASAHNQSAQAKVVTVAAGKPSEFGFALSTKTIAHGTVTFKVKNSGALPHDYKVCISPKGGKANSCAGKSTPLLSPGQSATLTVSFKTAGTYEYLCAVSGHAAAGMKGDLKVS